MYLPMSNHHRYCSRCPRRLAHDLALVEAELTTEAESPDATVLFREQNRIFCLDGNLGFVRLG